MKVLKIISIFSLFLIIAMVSILEAINFDDNLIASDKQIVIHNLKDNQKQITKLATQNNLIVYSANQFSYHSKPDGITHTIIKNQIYANTEYKKSPFYLANKNRDNFKNFLKDQDTVLYNLNELKNQEIVDLWVVYQNLDDYDSFVKQLRNSKIIFDELDVSELNFDFDYKGEYLTAIVMFLIIVIVLNIISILKGSKNIALRLIYQKKKHILILPLKDLIKNIVICLIVFFTFTILIYFYNGLNGSSLIYQSYLQLSTIALITIIITSYFSLFIVIKKLNYIKTINNYVSNIFIFRILNAIIIVAIVVSAHFFDLFLSSLSFLDVKQIDNQALEKNNKKYGIDSLSIMSRPSFYIGNENSDLYNKKLHDLTNIMQKDFKAVVMYFDLDGSLIVNANYILNNDLSDKKGNKIKAIDTNRSISLNKELQEIDFNSDDYSVRKFNKIKQIKFDEFDTSGNRDMFFDYQANKETINKMIVNNGFSDVVNSINSTDFSIYDKQTGSVIVEATKQGLNFIFFFIILLFTFYLNYLTYIEINKKKLGIKLVYKNNVLSRYIDLFLFVILNMLASIMFAKFMYNGEYSIKFVTVMILVNLMFILLYSRIIERNDIKKWLNGG